MMQRYIEVKNNKTFIIKKMISKFPNESLNPSPPSAGTGTGYEGCDPCRADFLEVPTLATLCVSLQYLLRGCHS